MQRSRAWLASLPFVVLSVTACGGGGGDAGSKPSAFGGAVDPAAVGAYMGNVTGSPIPSIKNFLSLILEDGSYWSMYGAQISGVYQIAGFMQGTTAGASNGSFTLMDGKDFGASPALAATVSGSYVAGVSLTGSVLYGSGITTGFNGSPIPSAAYDYNAPARLSDIAGAWTLALVAGTSFDSATINISNLGAIGAVSTKGCAFSGSASPRASGKNVYDVTLNFGASPCVLAGQTVKGVAVSYPVGATQRQLVTLLVNSDRTIGVRASGTR